MPLFRFFINRTFFQFLCCEGENRTHLFEVNSFAHITLTGTSQYLKLQNKNAFPSMLYPFYWPQSLNLPLFYFAVMLRRKDSNLRMCCHCRNQSPVPYHLATHQFYKIILFYIKSVIFFVLLNCLYEISVRFELTVSFRIWFCRPLPSTTRPRYLMCFRVVTIHLRLRLQHNALPFELLKHN